MPRTVLKGSPALEIILDGNKNAYRAGDTITGRVIRSAPAVSSGALLAIELHGRSKSKMTVSRGQAGTSIYHGRFNFFDPVQTSQQLLNGPLHIAPETGPQEFVFSITIPSVPDPTAVATGNEQKHSYLPLGQQDVATHSLPPVFHMSGFFITTAYHCYVEYYLKAELHLDAQSSKGDTATLPINITPPSTPDVITNFNLYRSSYLCRFHSHNLVPGMETAGLSLHQRTQQLFGSSKVPSYALSLQVDSPSVIQVGNTSPIPFRLLAIPEPAQTTESIRDISPTITLTAMKLEIEAATEMLCAGHMSHKADQKRKASFDLKSAIAQHGSPIVLPSGEKSEPLDVGALLQMTIASAAPTSLRALSGHKAELFPSFETYNIKHSHRMKWELAISAAGESTTLSNEVDITILPLHELPPSALPSYEENEGGERLAEKKKYLE